MNSKIKQVSQLLDEGGVVIFPTDTVFALSAKIDSKQAIDKIYKIKKRSKDNPLAVLVKDAKQAAKYVKFDDRAKLLAKKFWPGALTLVLPIISEENYIKNLNPGLTTLGVRCPNHEVAQEILLKCKTPLVATSANISGEKSSVEDIDIEERFSGLVDEVIYSKDYISDSSSGVSSTVVALLENGKVKVLREGGISEDELKEVLDS